MAKSPKKFRELRDDEKILATDRFSLLPPGDEPGTSKFDELNEARPCVIGKPYGRARDGMNGSSTAKALGIHVHYYRAA